MRSSCLLFDPRCGKIDNPWHIAWHDQWLPVESMNFPELTATGSPLLWLLGAISAVTFVGTLLAVPWAIARIPADYFDGEQRKRTWFGQHHPVLRLLLLAIKNLLGVLLLLLGILMLILPGQGLLTILAAIILLDFPGKYRFECWLIRRPPVLKAVNWLRHRHGRSPFEFD